MPATRLHGADCRRCVCSTVQPALLPLCCHSHLSVHHSHYLKLCRQPSFELPFALFFTGPDSPALQFCCIAAAQGFHETGNVSGGGGGYSRALKLKGCCRLLLPLRSVPMCAGGEFKAVFFCLRPSSLSVAEGSCFHIKYLCRLKERLSV